MNDYTTFSCDINPLSGGNLETDFTVIPDWTIHHAGLALPLGEACVYSVIYTASKGRRGFYVCRHKDLAELFNLSERTVRRFLGHLVDSGLVEQIPTVRNLPNGSRIKGPMAYRVIQEPINVADDRVRKWKQKAYAMLLEDDLEGIGTCDSPSGQIGRTEEKAQFAPYGQNCRTEPKSPSGQIVRTADGTDCPHGNTCGDVEQNTRSKSASTSRSLIKTAGKTLDRKYIEEEEEEEEDEKTVKSFSSTSDSSSPRRRGRHGKASGTASTGSLKARQAVPLSKDQENALSRILAISSKGDLVKGKNLIDTRKALLSLCEKGYAPDTIAATFEWYIEQFYQRKVDIPDAGDPRYEMFPKSFLTRATGFFAFVGQVPQSRLHGKREPHDPDAQKPQVQEVEVGRCGGDGWWYRNWIGVRTPMGRQSANWTREQAIGYAENRLRGETSW